jgi:hypothetical protein
MLTLEYRAALSLKARDHLRSRLQEIEERLRGGKHTREQISAATKGAEEMTRKRWGSFTHRSITALQYAKSIIGDNNFNDLLTTSNVANNNVDNEMLVEQNIDNSNTDVAVNVITQVTTAKRSLGTLFVNPVLTTNRFESLRVDSPKRKTPETTEPNSSSSPPITSPPKHKPRSDKTTPTQTSPKSPRFIHSSLTTNPTLIEPTSDPSSPPPLPQRDPRLLRKLPPIPNFSLTNPPTEVSKHSAPPSESRVIGARFAVDPKIVFSIVNSNNVEQPGLKTIINNGQNMSVEVFDNVETLIIGSSNLKRTNLVDIRPNCHIICIPGANLEYTTKVLRVIIAMPYDLTKLKHIVFTSGINNRDDVNEPPIIKLLSQCSQLPHDVEVFYMGISYQKETLSNHARKQIDFINGKAKEILGDRNFISELSPNDCFFAHDIHYDDSTVRKIIQKINKSLLDFHKY